MYLYAKSDQPDAIFAVCVATVSNILCLARLRLSIVWVDFNVVVSCCLFTAASVSFPFRDNVVFLIPDCCLRQPQYTDMRPTSPSTDKRRHTSSRADT